MEIDRPNTHSVRITLKKTIFLFYPDCEHLPKSPESATVIMISCPSQGFAPLVDKNTKLVIDGAGEYEVDDFSIQGTQVSNEPIRTVYRLTSPDGVKLVFLPELTAEMLTDKVLEGIGLVDVLVVPAGQLEGKHSPVETAKTVRTLAPKVVIPLTDKPEITEQFIKEVGGTLHSDEKVFKSRLLSALEEGQHIYVLN